MSLFDQLVDEALKNRRDLAPLRMVVEKELLHPDILRVLSHAGMLAWLTFIGGTSGLILKAESREEIFADKLVAFALRPNRIKHRDLWDLAWLHQQGVKPHIDLVPVKLSDHRCAEQDFLRLLEERRLSLAAVPEVAIEFRKEMRRFLPADLVAQTVDQADFWTYLTGLIDDLVAQTARVLSGQNGAPTAIRFRM